MNDAVRSFVVAVDDDGIRLDRWFKRHLPEASFNLVSRWARTGQLRVDGRRATPGDRIEAGQSIRVPPAEPVVARVARPAPAMPSEEEIAFARSLVIHIDDSAIVINKPPGLATQGGTGTTVHVDGLLDALRFDAPTRPKLVHRLDKDTSGVLLLARTPRAAAFFARGFASRSARKVYWALVIGVPALDRGWIDLPLAKQPGSGGEKMHVDYDAGSEARTQYRMIDRAGNRAAWLELQPQTGRTHQLRVHLAAIGNPIVGDGKYGGREAFLTGSVSRKMHLHAHRLRVDHPDGGRLDVTAPLPPHMLDSFAQLGFDLAAGEAALDPPPTTAPAESRHRAAAAKERRQARRGERRSRGQA
jgi:23S rRNA pseudouridine955/2504/2580 synthase